MLFAISLFSPGRRALIFGYKSPGIKGRSNSALKAMKAIVDQGEGASAYNPLQQNVDSSELAHYFKFSSIFHGRQITTFNVTNENVYNNNEQVNQRYCTIALYILHHTVQFHSLQSISRQFISSRILTNSIPQYLFTYSLPSYAIIVLRCCNAQHTSDTITNFQKLCI